MLPINRKQCQSNRTYPANAIAIKAQWNRHSLETKSSSECGYWPPRIFKQQKSHEKNLAG